MPAVYDTIGNNYDVTRKADPEIARRIYHHLQLDNGSRVLDIGCGTGNYTISLQDMGLVMVGTDISSTMLKGASAKSLDIPWIKADAGNLPFEESEFRGAISTLVIHHFPELDAPFREAYRVISEGRFVIFTSSPEQMEKYWLVEYFPSAIQAACKQMPSFDKVMTALEKAGFSIAGIETFMVQPDIQDFFLYSGKYHPEIYLNAKVREGISTFASLEFVDEVQEGCRRLRQDMDSGRIYSIFSKYSSTAGDYMFIVAQKGWGFGSVHALGEMAVIPGE